MPEIVSVGKLGKSHGLAGWMRFFAAEAVVVTLENCKPWYVKLASSQKEDTRQCAEVHWQALAMQTHQVYAPTAHICYVRFAHCKDVQSTKCYRNALLGVLRDSLPPLEPGAFYWSDLEGLKVVGSSGECFGRVSHLFETGSNDVLVVRGKREYLIPYTDSAVLAVDLGKGKIVVDWDLDF